MSTLLQVRLLAKRRNKAKGTGAEVLLRKALWARGARYRLHAKDLPDKPDIVFPKQKVAVFVDGDFWHGRNWGELEKSLRPWIVSPLMPASDLTHVPRSFMNSRIASRD